MPGAAARGGEEQRAEAQRMRSIYSALHQFKGKCKHVEFGVARMGFGRF